MFEFFTYIAKSVLRNKGANVVRLMLLLIALFTALSENRLTELNDNLQKIKVQLAGINQKVDDDHERIATSSLLAPVQKLNDLPPPSSPCQCTFVIPHMPTPKIMLPVNPVTTGDHHGTRTRN